MQIMRVPPGNMSHGSSNGSRPYKIGNRSAVKDLDREVGIDHTDHLSEVCNVSRACVVGYTLGHPGAKPGDVV